MLIVVEYLINFKTFDNCRNNQTKKIVYTPSLFTLHKPANAHNASSRKLRSICKGHEKFIWTLSATAHTT
jgi:hypothetical protein